VTSTSITVRTRSKRCAINRRRARRQEVGLTESSSQADLVPTVGAAVGRVLAGSWTGPGNEVREQQQRPEDEAERLRESPADLSQIPA